MTDKEAAAAFRKRDVEEVHCRMERAINNLDRCTEIFREPLTCTRNDVTYGIELPGLNTDDVSDIRNHIDKLLDAVKRLSLVIHTLTPPF